MRQILLVGGPLILPLGLYLLWYRRAMRAAEASGTELPRLGDVPWPWLVAIALMLLVSALGAASLMDRAAPGGRYEPPHLVDGKVVPGHVVPEEAAPRQSPR